MGCAGGAGLAGFQPAGEGAGRGAGGGDRGGGGASVGSDGGGGTNGVSGMVRAGHFVSSDDRGVSRYLGEDVGFGAGLVGAFENSTGGPTYNACAVLAA